MENRLRLRPNPRQTSFEWRRQVFASLLLRSNAYCQMIPVERGAFDLIPLHPDRVSGPEDSGGFRRWWYQPAAPGSPRVSLIEDVDLWHLQGLSEDGIKGLSMVDLARDSIGIAKASEQHRAGLLSRGATFTGVLEHPAKLDSKTAKEMGESFSRVYGGSPGVGKTPVLWEGMKYSSIGMSSKDAEFLDSMKFGVNDVARWFGIPPHLLSDVEKTTSWGAGIEEQNLQFLVVTLLPWITLFEQAYRARLIYQPDRFYPKLNVNAMLRVSAETRYKVFAIGIQQGILSPNECRELEDMNPRAGGDVWVTPTAPQQSRSDGPPAPRRTEDDDAQALAIAESLRLSEESAERLAQAAVITARDRAQALARAAAHRIATEEHAAIVELAKRHQTNPKSWRQALASYYGRHAAHVAEALQVSTETARGYCRGRVTEVAEGYRLQGPETGEDFEWFDATAIEAALIELTEVN